MYKRIAREMYNIKWSVKFSIKSDKALKDFWAFITILRKDIFYHVPLCHLHSYSEVVFFVKKFI